MRINVKLMGWMREYLDPGIERFDDRDFDLDDGTTLGALCDRFGFRSGETDFMAMLNGERIVDDALDVTRLTPDDKVVFVPPIKGG
jgi:molybdopterin converting factor small subunit